MSDLTETVVRRTIEVAETPAPTGAEHRRAALVRGWWERDGFADVRTESAGNVWARGRAGHGGEGRIVVLCAHLDTVFGPDVSHATRLDGDALIGPSVGDDSVGLASIGAAASLLSSGRAPVWLLATVGEEGFGNLRGVNAALDDPPAEIAAFIAVEGNYLGRVSTTGVGSARRRVTVRGPGGHAWEDAHVPSATNAIATIAAAIAALPAPTATSVNIGRLGGGEGINVRAREAWLELDLRADDPAALAALAAEVDRTLTRVDPPLVVEQEPLGERPAGRLGPAHPLALAAVDALAEIGIEAEAPGTSTDANAAHARGIPAIAIGVTTGSGEHTARERIDIGPIEDGVRALARTVERFEELSR